MDNLFKNDLLYKILSGELELSDREANDLIKRLAKERREYSVKAKELEMRLSVVMALVAKMKAHYDELVAERDMLKQYVHPKDLARIYAEENDEQA